MSIEEHERLLKELSPTKAMFLFLVNLSAFERLALKYDIASEITRTKDIRAAYEQGKYRPRVEV